MIKRILKNIIPDVLKAKLISKMDQANRAKFMKRLRQEIFDYYNQKKELTVEEREVVDYLKINPITVFPYDFQKKYHKESIIVETDLLNGLKYVLHEGKKLYFKRSSSEQQIRSLYHGLQLDQDTESPHLYLTEKFNLSNDDIIADIGAAEGNFSLSNIEKVKKIHLFEYDPEWIEALKATFKPWESKVVIHNKFVSNTNSENTISIDNFAKNNDDITFFKVDIEGEEENFLDGAKHFLKSRAMIKMAICTYHKQEDEKKFTTILESNDFKVHPSNRYMLFFYDEKIKPPFLRRGLLRAEKMNSSDD